MTQMPMEQPASSYAEPQNDLSSATFGKVSKSVMDKVNQELSLSFDYPRIGVTRFFGSAAERQNLLLPALDQAAEWASHIYVLINGETKEVPLPNGTSYTGPKDESYAKGWVKFWADKGRWGDCVVEAVTIDSWKKGIEAVNEAVTRAKDLSHSGTITFFSPETPIDLRRYQMLRVHLDDATVMVSARVEGQQFHPALQKPNGTYEWDPTCAPRNTAGMYRIADLPRNPLSTYLREAYAKNENPPVGMEELELAMRAFARHSRHEFAEHLQNGGSPATRQYRPGIVKVVEFPEGPIPYIQTYWNKGRVDNHASKFDTLCPETGMVIVRGIERDMVEAGINRLKRKHAAGAIPSIKLVKIPDWDLDQE